MLKLWAWQDLTVKTKSLQRDSWTSNPQQLAAISVKWLTICTRRRSIPFTRKSKGSRTLTSSVKFLICHRFRQSTRCLGETIKGRPRTYHSLMNLLWWELPKLGCTHKEKVRNWRNGLKSSDLREERWFSWFKVMESALILVIVRVGVWVMGLVLLLLLPQRHVLALGLLLNLLLHNKFLTTAK